MKTTAFEIPKDIKDSQDYFPFPLRPPIAERPAPPNIQEDILEKYKEYIRQRREEERRSEFPEGARFIEPPIKLRVKKMLVEQMPLSGTGERIFLGKEKKSLSLSGSKTS